MKTERAEVTVLVHREVQGKDGKKKTKSEWVRRPVNSAVISSMKDLESLWTKTSAKEIPEAIVLRIDTVPGEKVQAISRADILSVNKQIAHEKTLSDKAEAEPLLAVYIDGLLKTQVNDNCTGTLARGTTGCGKTVCIGNMLLHQAYTHQSGIIRTEWWKSQNFLQTYKFQLEMERESSEILASMKDIETERNGLESSTLAMRDAYLQLDQTIRHYELERGELEGLIKTRLRALRRMRTGGKSGAVAIAGRLSCRPVFHSRNAITGAVEEVPSAFTVPLEEAMTPPTCYDDFRGARPALCDISAWMTRMGRNDAGDQPAESWADDDEELRQLRETHSRILAKESAAKSSRDRMQLDYDAYITKRQVLNDRADDAGYKLTKLTRKIRHICFTREVLNLKYKRMPWGGLLIDQKGSYHETVSNISKAYAKLPLLTLIQVRPSWAQAEKDRHRWTPLVKWNLLSMPKNLITSEAYAEIFSSTGASFKGGGGGGGDKNDYFVKGSQGFIAQGIELGRECCEYAYKLESAKARENNDPRPVKLKIPSLVQIYRFLVDKDKFTYQRFLEKYGFKEIIEKGGKDALNKLARLKDVTLQLEALRRSGNYTDQHARDILGGEGAFDATKYRIEFMSSSLIKCMEEFETYFSYDKGQLSGLTGTIQNTLSPYVSEDMEEIFASEDDNTVDISDIDYGVVFCLAMSQKYAVERKYLCVLLKKLIYFHNRLRNDKPGWDLDTYKFTVGGNAHYVFQDECQDTITDDDQEVDKFRSQGMCAVFLTQSLVALYQRLGNRERAQTFFNNINNLYIGTAGDDECAEASAKAIGRFMAAEFSYNRQKGLHNLMEPGGYSYSDKERFIIRPHEIRSLPKFTFIVAMKSQSSEKGAAVRRFLVGPRDADGVTPRQWWPGMLKNRDRWGYWKCRWNDEFPEFTKLPLTFNIKPTA